MNQVLEFIKAHTLALVCGVVALIAIGVYFFYVPGLIAEVDNKVATETREPYTKLDDLRNKARTWFNYDVAGGEPAALGVFPTQRLVDLGNAKLKELTQQAGEALAEIRKSNEMPLLVPGSLPITSSFQRQLFFDAYRDATAQTGQAAENGIIRKILQGALPPDAKELENTGNARANQISRTKLMLDATGKATNQEQVNAEIAAMKAGLETEMRVERARTSKIYVSPTAVAIHPLINGQVGQIDANTVFNAQVMLWLQQISMAALAECNKGATNVLDAPVKHLIALNVPIEVAPVAGRTGGNIGFGAPPPAEGEAAPATLTPDATVEIKPDYKRSPLGYGNNSLYDTVPISMVIRLDVRQLPTVLSTLGKGRLLKVTNVASVRTVDIGTALADKYIYDQTGKTPIVEATIECDVLLLRTWLAPLMPPDVKTYFNNLSNPQPAA